MSLVENALFDQNGDIAKKPIDKIEIALETLKMHEPEEGYYVAYSGGKDSTVILDLVRRSGVKYDAHYNVTTVDPPELVQFIRTQTDVILNLPEISMRNLIIKKGFPPTRLARYCCEHLKERGGTGRWGIITGVRAAESARRSKRRQIEVCKKDSSQKFIHLIFNWSTKDVWEYIKTRELPYCSLYDEGFKRLGCIGCPLAPLQKRLKEFELWPAYKKLYLNAFDEMLKARGERGLTSEGWQTGEDVFNWWTSKRKEPEHEGQGSIFE